LKALITRKIGMTSVIGDNGELNAVTLLSATPNVITHIKNTEADGYQAVQQGFEEVKPERIGKSLAGHLKNSKGKGFAGTIKRHNFKRGRKTHGGRSYRRPGSIGSMYPQHIFKGKKMAGQMGHERVTTKKLKVAFVDNELNVIGVIGAVPGPKKGIVLLKETK
jgi:large subunit ribosomal protein L3